MNENKSLQQKSVESVKKRGFHEIGDLPSNSFLPLLSAQRMRFEEEWGEFNRALRKNDSANIASELADVQIVLYQIAHVLGISLEVKVIQKLEKDEKRGRLHGGAIANVQRRDDGPASLNEIANEHIIYAATEDGLQLADYKNESGVD